MGGGKDPLVNLGSFFRCVAHGSIGPYSHMWISLVSGSCPLWLELAVTMEK